MRVSATGSQMTTGAADCQNCAVCVSNALLAVLVALPRVFTSLSSVA